MSHRTAVSSAEPPAGPDGQSPADAAARPARDANPSVHAAGATDHLRVALFSPRARHAWGGLMAVLAVFVTYKALSVVPAGPSFSWDKLNHVGAFAALAFAGLFTFRAKARPVFWVSFLLLAFGVAIEIAQLYVPGRYAELEDVLADAVGIGLGLLMADQLARRADRRRHRRDTR